MGSDVFSGKLLTGEQILWFGQPSPGMVFRDHPLMLYLLVPCVTWDPGLVSSKASWLSNLCGTLALVSLCGLAWILLRDAYLRRQTHYVLTTNRILILQCNLDGEFKGMSLDHLPEPMLEGGKKGKGTISFEQPILGWMGIALPSWTLMFDPAAKFATIDDAERVFTLVQRAMHPA